MAEFEYKEDECRHEHVHRDIVMGCDSGDRVCSDCGKMAYGNAWIAEDRKRLHEKARAGAKKDR